MLKAIITYLIQKKNPDFKLDKTVTSSLLMELAIQKMMQKIRGKRLWFSLRSSQQLFLGKGVKFFNLANIKFGKWVQLEDHVYVSGLSKRPVEFGDNVKIGAWSRIVASTSFNNIGEYIKIGDNVGIGEYAYLGGGGGLEIGNDCIIGQYFSCHPENHCYTNSNELIRLQGVTRKGITVGENCWIGAKVTILDGVTIGSDCVIAAGAVVNKSMPSNVVIGGVPARVLKTIEKKEHVKVMCNGSINPETINAELTRACLII